MEKIILNLIFISLGGLIWAAIWAVFLRAAAKWVVGSDISFFNAMVTTILLALTAAIVLAPVFLVPLIAPNSASLAAAAFAVALLVGFLVHCWVVGQRLEVSVARGGLVYIVMHVTASICGLLISGITAFLARLL